MASAIQFSWEYIAIDIYTNIFKQNNSPKLMSKMNSQLDIFFSLFAQRASLLYRWFNRAFSLKLKWLFFSSLYIINAMQWQRKPNHFCCYFNARNFQRMQTKIIIKCSIQCIGSCSTHRERHTETDTREHYNIQV